MHLTAEANVPDHCITYALDLNDKSLCVACQHDHETSCLQCEVLKSALKEIEELFLRIPPSPHLHLPECSTSNTSFESAPAEVSATRQGAHNRP